MSLVLPSLAPPPRGPGDPKPLPGPLLTVDEYIAACAAGTYGDHRTELLDGRVYLKMPQSERHAAIMEILRVLLAAVLPAGYHVSGQVPNRTPRSMPEPDVFVRRGTIHDYLARHPTAADIPLVAEVSYSTVHTDRGVKRPMYAGAAYAVYWIVNLSQNQVEVYTDPDPATRDYLTPAVYVPGYRVPVVNDGQEVGTLAATDVLALPAGP